MSEPVGNSPRNIEVEGNSHKTREVEAAAKEVKDSKEPLDKVVTGKVVTRKQAWWKRAAHSMIADDATSIGDFILLDVLVPAAKNLIRDIIVGGTDRTLYGTARASRRFERDRGGDRVSRISTRYDRMAEEPRGREMPREARARHDFQMIVLDSKQEAEDVIDALVERIVRYGAASVTDLYDACGVSGSYADQRWGWTDLSTADVLQRRGGWLIDLPNPEPLR